MARLGTLVYRLSKWLSDGFTRFGFPEDIASSRFYDGVIQDIVRARLMRLTHHRWRSKDQTGYALEYPVALPEHMETAFCEVLRTHLGIKSTDGVIVEPHNESAVEKTVRVIIRDSDREALLERKADFRIKESNFVFHLINAAVVFLDRLKEEQPTVIIEKAMEELFTYREMFATQETVRTLHQRRVDGLFAFIHNEVHHVFTGKPRQAKPLERMLQPSNRVDGIRCARRLQREVEQDEQQRSC